jgi:hypothetical protein
MEKLVGLFCFADVYGIRRRVHLDPAHYFPQILEKVGLQIVFRQYSGLQSRVLELHGLQQAQRVEFEKHVGILLEQVLQAFKQLLALLHLGLEFLLEIDFVLGECALLKDFVELLKDPLADAGLRNNIDHDFVRLLKGAFHNVKAPDVTDAV